MELSSKDPRSPFEKDRDRVLYSDYFTRLVGVTQVASAAEGGVFHNRLTHSLKVAQVARRLAERLASGTSPGLINPDVVETAALAHDLGHPPFGHAGEKALCAVAEELGLEDGFEGNAQTFRILTRLAISRHPGRFGLDLTRASLAAASKYPWLRDLNPDSKEKARSKFGAYKDDEAALRFACGESPKKSLDAEIMDLADAITYSIHDFEDFYRAGLIPLERLVRNSKYRREFVRRWRDQSQNSESALFAAGDDGWEMLENLLQIPLSELAEPGGQKEAELLEGFRSRAITQFLDGVKVDERGELSFAKEYHHQTKFLQRLIWDYVILSPRLAIQQVGQARIVQNLARFFWNALEAGCFERVPTRFRLMAEAVRGDEGDYTLRRLAIDIVASLSESDAISMHRKIMGQDSGSVMDPVR